MIERATYAIQVHEMEDYKTGDVTITCSFDGKEIHMTLTRLAIYASKNFESVYKMVSDRCARNLGISIYLEPYLWEKIKELPSYQALEKAEDRRRFEADMVYDVWRSKLREG